MKESAGLRLWEECSFEPEGRVVARGTGSPDVFERFVISANGTEMEMIVTTVESGRRWTAQDVDSFERAHRQ